MRLGELAEVFRWKAGFPAWICILGATGPGLYGNPPGAAVRLTNALMFHYRSVLLETINLKCEILLALYELNILRQEADVLVCEADFLSMTSSRSMHRTSLFSAESSIWT